MYVDSVNSLLVLLTYFCSVIFFCRGWLDNNLIWIGLALFLLLMGTLFNISNKVNVLLSILNGADVKYEYFEDMENIK